MSNATDPNPAGTRPARSEPTGHGGSRKGAGRKPGPSARTRARHALIRGLVGGDLASACRIPDRELHRLAAIDALMRGDRAAMEEFAALSLRLGRQNRSGMLRRSFGCRPT